MCETIQKVMKIAKTFCGISVRGILFLKTYKDRGPCIADHVHLLKYTSEYTLVNNTKVLVESDVPYFQNET